MSRHVVVRPVLLAAAVAAGLAGCPLESLFPAEVGAGAARLTVRNAALLAKFVDLDTRCGFGSPDVLAGFTVDGEVGEVGQVTWRVDGCVLDFGDDTVINEDCHGVTRRAGGRVTIDAVRTVRGVLTGDPITPVVPLAADAAHLEPGAHVAVEAVKLPAVEIRRKEVHQVPDAVDAGRRPIGGADARRVPARLPFAFVVIVIDPPTERLVQARALVHHDAAVAVMIQTESERRQTLVGQQGREAAGQQDGREPEHDARLGRVRRHPQPQCPDDLKVGESARPDLRPPPPRLRLTGGTSE
ncbi:MAG: hypothetical protein ACO268_09980 [Opitutales bacterium]